jgi:hypothetical protein
MDDTRIVKEFKSQLPGYFPVQRFIFIEYGAGKE